MSFKFKTPRVYWPGMLECDSVICEFNYGWLSSRYQMLSVHYSQLD